MLTSSGGDRALQDALIRLLADAPFRDAIGALTEGQGYDDIPAEHIAVLRAADPDRVHRFARFLARQYYYERIVHFHRYSRSLARWTRRRPEDVLRRAEFDALLPSLVLGGRETARDLARLLYVHLAHPPGAPPYAADLVRYENAQLVAEAGPRLWRSDEVRRPLTGDSMPARAPDASVHDFDWDLPPLLPSLLAAAADASASIPPPDGTPARITLLFARSPRGRVSVLRSPPAVVTFLSLLDGSRSIAAAAQLSGIPGPEAVAITNELAQVGAVVDETVRRCTREPAAPHRAACGESRG
jgi:hypothetical protein